MKKLSLLIVAVVLMSAVLSACGGGAGGDSPASVVKAWNEATSVAQDAAKAKALTCAAFQPTIDMSIGLMQSMNAKTDISALKYEEQNVTAATANVRVTGKVKVDIAGTVTDQDFDQVIPVIKEGGKWVACPVTP